MEPSFLLNHAGNLKITAFINFSKEATRQLSEDWSLTEEHSAHSELKVSNRSKEWYIEVGTAEFDIL